MSHEFQVAADKAADVFRRLFHHPGHGVMTVEFRWSGRGRREVLITSGKQFRFLVPAEQAEKEVSASEE